MGCNITTNWVVLDCYYQIPWLIMFLFACVCQVAGWLTSPIAFVKCTDLMILFNQLRNCCVCNVREEMLIVSIIWLAVQRISTGLCELFLVRHKSKLRVISLMQVLRVPCHILTNVYWLVKSSVISQSNMSLQQLLFMLCHLFILL